GDTPPGRQRSSSFHPLQFEAMRAQQGAVSDLFAFGDLWDANIVANGEAEVADGQFVSDNYFAALGVPAFLGRTITEADDDPTAPPVAVISYRYWQTRFGGDPAVIGKQVAVNKVSFTVVGVTPPTFTGTLQVDSNPVVTVPLAFEPTVSGKSSNMPGPDNPGIWWLYLMGRLNPGAT